MCVCIGLLFELVLCVRWARVCVVCVGLAFALDLCVCWARVCLRCARVCIGIVIALESYCVRILCVLDLCGCLYGW